MMDPKISICIATWNRSKKLKNIILLLENQSISRDNYEIIIVDSYSPDNTADVVRQLQRVYTNIKYIENAKNVLAVKRNVGVDAASSEIIVFMDDDVYPSKRFIEEHLLANEKSNDTFFCGQIRFEKDSVNTSNYYRFRDRQHLCKKDIGKKLPFNKIVVMNLSFKKAYYSIVGGVKEEYVGYGCEDTDFGWRIKESGYSIKYLPEAIAIHKEDSSNIKEYGNKLYKTGLYGSRIFKELCPKGYETTNRYYNIVGIVLSTKIISFILEKFLLFTDSYPFFYSYYLYKAYLYSQLYRGKKDQKSIKPLNNEDLKKGW